MKKWIILALTAVYTPICLGAAPDKNAANNLFAVREEVERALGEGGGEQSRVAHVVGIPVEALLLRHAR